MTFFFDFDIFSIAPISNRLPFDLQYQRCGNVVDRCPDRDLRRLHPLSIFDLIGLVHDHALGEQAGERLVEADMAGRLHRAGEEAGIEQMQNRVLDAADVLVDRQPAVDHGAVGRRAFDPGVGEAREIPGRVHEGVHGIGLAPRGLAALRAVDVLPGRVAVERVAGAVEGDVVGQGDR